MPDMSERYFTPEEEAMLRAFMRRAHSSAYPSHDFRGREEEAVMLARGDDSAIGALMIFPERRTRLAIAPRLEDFARGWHAKAQQTEPR